MIKSLLQTARIAAWCGSAVAGAHAAPVWTPLPLGIAAGVCGWMAWRIGGRVTTGRPDAFETLPHMVTRLDWQVALGITVAVAAYAFALVLRVTPSSAF